MNFSEKISSWFRKFDDQFSLTTCTLPEETKKSIEDGIKLIRESASEASNGFDKAITTISSAGIGWIFVNVKKDVPVLCGTKAVVAFFSAALFSTVLSYYLAHQGNNKYIDESNDALMTSDLNKICTLKAWEMKVAGFLNSFSLVMFAAALVTICSVVYNG